ncbi:MAG: NACHT domain-containing protein [Bacteroidota bacterium]
MERSIESVRHEYSEALPIDDVVVETADTIECYQAKHAANPHELIGVDDLIGSTDLRLGIDRLAKAWQRLQGSGKSILIRVFTNRSADASLAAILDGDSIRDTVIEGAKQVRTRRKLQAAAGIEDEDLFRLFLRCLRFNLRQPDVHALAHHIEQEWLARRLGLAEPGAYARFMSEVERWYLERSSRPILRHEVMAALDVDAGPIPQRFPVDWRTFVSRPEFEREVVGRLLGARRGYVALAGPPGSGKSTLITNLVRTFRQRGQPFVRYYAFTQVNDPLAQERVGASAFLRSVLDQLRREFSHILPDERRHDYSPAALRVVLAELGKHFAQQNRRLILIVDGADHVGRAVMAGPDKLLAVLPPELPEGVVCLVGTQSTTYLPPPIERQCREEGELLIPLFTESQTHEYIRRSLPPERQPAAAIRRAIHTRSEGLPLYLRYIVEQLEAVGRAAQAEFVTALPQLDGQIGTYYGALWDEFKEDPALLRLSGLAARLRFRVQVDELLRMAGVEDAFERTRLLARVRHLLLITEAGCRVFHDSFREFVQAELDAEHLRQLDGRILEYLDDRPVDLLWYTYAHRYAEAAGESEYLIRSFGRPYIERAIARGRPAGEISAALTAAARAAAEQRDWVALATLSALISHTETRLSYHLDRAQLWRCLLALGETEAALAAFSNDGEVLDISAETARILVHLADQGQTEAGAALAKDFFEHLPRQIDGGDYTVAVGELLAVFGPRGASTLARWIGAPPPAATGRSFDPPDVGGQLLPRVLQLYLQHGSWDRLRVLRRLVQRQPGWEARRDRWHLELTHAHAQHLPSSAPHVARAAERTVRDPHTRLLLAGIVARYDLGRELANALMGETVLTPQLEFEEGHAPTRGEFATFRALVRTLTYLDLPQEIAALESYFSTSASSVAAYYRVILAAASASDPVCLLSSLDALAEHRRQPGERTVELHGAVLADLPGLLEDVVDRYTEAHGDVAPLLAAFRRASEGETFSVGRITGLRVLSEIAPLRQHLRPYLEEAHDETAAAELETDGRASALLDIAELAARCGFTGLGRMWFEEGVRASGGYGYRKDYTVSFLLDALEVAHRADPVPLRHRMADIAEWNTTIYEFAHGKGTRWFPRQLFDLAMEADRAAALGLLGSYRRAASWWQFSDVLARFLQGYKGDDLPLAFVLSEFVDDVDFGDEAFGDKVDTRMHLLRTAVRNSPALVDWIGAEVRRFLMTEVGPRDREAGVHAYNEIARDAGLEVLPTGGGVPTPPSGQAPSYPSPPENLRHRRAKVWSRMRLAASVDAFEQRVEKLVDSGAEPFHVRDLLLDAVRRLVGRTTVTELDRLANAAARFSVVEEESHGLFAAAYLQAGEVGRAVPHLAGAFAFDNRYLGSEEIKLDALRRLADLDPRAAADALYRFAERLSLKGYGYPVFTLLIKGAHLLGAEFHPVVARLYSAFHDFVRWQFEALPPQASGAFDWLRDPQWAALPFAVVARELVEQGWSEPPLHTRLHFVHLLRDLALLQPVPTTGWLAGLLTHADATLRVQSALVMLGVARAQPELLLEHADVLLDAVAEPHAERTFYLLETLRLLPLVGLSAERLARVLADVRPSLHMPSTQLVLPRVSPSPDFVSWTLKNATPAVSFAIEEVAEVLGLDLDYLHWRVEQEATRAGYSRKEAERRHQENGRAYFDHVYRRFIPFETYDGHHVWHGFNVVLEDIMRSEPVSNEDRLEVNSIIRSYDPVFPRRFLEPKPSDLTLPYIADHDDGDGDDLQQWLRGAGREPLTVRTLGEAESTAGWVVVHDEVRHTAGRAGETRRSVPLLLTTSLAQAVAEGVLPFPDRVLVEKLAQEPPYHSLTIDEARSALASRPHGAGLYRSNAHPLVAAYHGPWWRYLPYTLSTLAAGWIQELGLAMKDEFSLDLLREGRPAQRLVNWQDGHDVGFGHRECIGEGSRLHVATDVLTTIMTENRLGLVLAEHVTRRISRRRYDREERDKTHTSKRLTVILPT